MYALEYKTPINKLAVTFAAIFLRNVNNARNWEKTLNIYNIGRS